MQAQPGNNKTEEKMKKILIIAAAVLAFAGCAKEASQVERVTIDGKEYMTFKVVAKDDVISADTKATLTRTGVFGWSDGEPIYFVAAGGTTATGSYNASAGTITVESGGWIFASNAPFDSDSKIKDFGMAKGPVVISKVEGSTLKFHHIGSVINVKFDTIPIDGYLEFWAEGGIEWHGGEFDFTGSTPKLMGEGADDIYIKWPITKSDAGKDITISVPNENYTSGFGVGLSGTSARYFQKITSKSFDLSTRPTLLNMQEVSVTLPSYTVAGNPASLFNDYSWAPDAVINDMELCPDGKTYVKTYKYLPPYVEFKVVENHAWGGRDWGDSGSNYVMNPPSKVGGGMTITFDPDRSPEIEVNEFDMYTVVGDSGLCGVNWENKDIEENAHWEATLVNDMEERSSGVYYKKLTGVAADTYEFKVARNHSWGSSWAADDDNFKFTTTAAGDVEIYFYLDIPSIKVVGWSEDYRVAGDSFFFGSNWGTADDNNLMEIQDDGTYSKSYPIPVGEDGWLLQFKVCRDGNWAFSKPAENVNITLEGGKTLTIKYNPVAAAVSYEMK